MQQKTHIRTGFRMRTWVGILLLTLFLQNMLADLPATCAAAASGNPLFLVNTEAFQVIDDSDDAGNPTLKFGEGLNKTLLFNRETEQFELNDDLEVMGTLSGSSLTVSDLKNCNTIDTDENGVLICGTDEGGAGGLSREIADTLYVNQAGDTMTGALVIDVEGGDVNTFGLRIMNTLSGAILHAEQALTSSGAFTTDGRATFNDVAVFNEEGTDAGHVRMESDTQENFFFFHAGLGRIGIGGTDTPETTLEVQGTISGALLTQNGAGNNYFMGNVGVGTTSPNTRLEVRGFASNPQNGLFVTTDTFSFLSAGSLLRFGHGAASGDTYGEIDNLTAGGGAWGNLVLQSGGGNVGIGTTTPDNLFHLNSGATPNISQLKITANDAGPVSILSYGVDNQQIGFDTDYDFGWKARYSSPGIFRKVAGQFRFSGDTGITPDTVYTPTDRMTIDFATGNIGIGTTAPETKLEVDGTISGATLHAYDFLGSQSATSGSVLVSRTSGAPEWRNPVGSMVWYIDGTAALGTRQSATVTMPFGMTATSVNLRVAGAPTGAAIIVDINEAGTTLFSTRPQIDDGSVTGGGGASFSDTAIAAGSELSIDIDQIGSTFAGSGLTIQLNGIRKY